MNIFSRLYQTTKDTSEIEQAIQAGAILIDVRTPGEFQMGSAKGAVNIPLEELIHDFSQLEDKKSIVLFCRSGARSGYAQSFLQQNGFEKVYNGGTWQSVEELVNKKQLQ